MYIIKMELSRTIYYQAGMNINRKRKLQMDEKCWYKTA